jgi:hypothetical protein
VRRYRVEGFGQDGEGEGCLEGEHVEGIEGAEDIEGLKGREEEDADAEGVG